jgi:hypothetical protein
MALTDLAITSQLSARDDPKKYPERFQYPEPDTFKNDTTSNAGFDPSLCANFGTSKEKMGNLHFSLPLMPIVFYPGRFEVAAFSA